MANEETPKTEATSDLESGADPKAPAAVEAAKVAPEHDATAPNDKLEPTRQDEGPDSDPAPGADDDHGHGHGADDHDHGLAHTMPVWMLVAVLGALMVLTVLTVSVTRFDLGSEGNLVVAMVIATVKAGLVVTFFMHLYWDKKFHLVLFLTAVLFVILFLSMSLTDRGEYQTNIDWYQSVSTANTK